MAYPNQPGGSYNPGYSPADPYQQYGQAPGGYAAQSGSGISVMADLNPLQFMLYLVKPVVTINGVRQEIAWSQPFVFPLAPGNWPIRVHFPWMFGDANVAQSWVEVHPGYVIDLRYSTSLFIFSAGTLVQMGARPWG